jgi:hypothetical protein
MDTVKEPNWGGRGKRGDAYTLWEGGEGVGA